MNKLIKALSLCFGLILLISWMYGGDQERIIVQTPFKSIKKVYPKYPEMLKNEGVAARFRILIGIDKKGNVRRAFVENSLYPELEKSIEEAFLQWKFEPFTHKGEPVGTFGFIRIIFYPGKLRPSVLESESTMKSIQEELIKIPNKELQMILDKCTEYTLKLSESALYYVCHEKIKEKFKKLEEKEREIGMTVGGHRDLQPDEIMQAEDKRLILTGSEKRNYIYDYQLIRKKGNVKEKRIPLEKNAKEISQEDILQETKPIYSLKPILVPTQLLTIEQRPRFLFKLAKDEKIKGKLVYVIEAYLRPGQMGNIRRGKLWVNKSDFRIVKAEVETNFVEGFEDILSECDNFYLKPHFKSTHYYEVEKNGILFPSRSEIRVEYSGLLAAKKGLKSELEVIYENYKFFTVETDHNIIKKKMDEFLLQRDRFSPLILKSLPAIKK